MWTRQELKEKGKAAFKANYWKSVVAGLVIWFLTGASTATAKGGSEDFNTLQYELNAMADQAGISVLAILGILLGIMGASLLIGFGFHIFLGNPLLVGANRFYLRNAQEPASLKELGYAFSSGRYGKIVLCVFLKNLFISLWSLLLIIPGIIKAYQYYLVNYILADDPEMEPMDALRRSKEMMQGQKWNVFVLDLSFIGWTILSVLTCGILEIFYVKPYVEATGAELYRTLKQQSPDMR